MNHVTRRALLTLLPVLVMTLSACGFEPLYSDRTNQRVDPLLAAVKVSPIHERIGQLLEWRLRENLNPDGIEVSTRYVLNVELTVSHADLGVQRDTSATRGQVTTVANFTLLDAKTKAVLYRSRSRSIGDYNVTNDAYAAQVALEDTQKRAVRDIADDIQTRLVTFLRDKAG